MFPESSTLHSPHFDVLKHSDSGLLHLEDSSLLGLFTTPGGSHLHGASSSSLDPLVIEAYNLELSSPSFDVTASTSGIQGTKWNDLNSNGLKDAGEPGLAGWTIYLDTNNNGKLDVGETSTTTDVNGNYSFTGLAPGTYTVAEVNQSGWQQTSPGTVPNGSFETGSLTSWNTIGNTGVQTASYGVTPTQGTYQALLTNGSGSVTDSALESFLGWSAGTLDAMGNGNATEGSAMQLSTVTVAAGTTLTFDWNFLTNEATPSSYNDFAFVSINGLTELADTNSKFVLTPGSVQQTGYKQFSYTFTAAGTYSIGLGVVDVGDTSVDSSLLVDNFALNATQVVNLAAGQTAKNINFGDKLVSGGGNQSGKIEGLKWNDLNGNSVKDVGESGLAGWTIYLDTNNNGNLDTGETSTVTDANGNYSFTNLVAGNYTVAEVLQPGWQQTSPGTLTSGFETGNFTGWTTQGKTSIETTYSGINPTQGTYQALITNSTGSVSDASLESFIGLSAGALDGMGNGNATEGSAIKWQTLTVAAGSTLTLDYNFLTTEGTGSYFNDFAFISVNGLKELADTNSTFVIPPGSVKQTGYKQFSYTFTTAGTYTIGLGVVDVGDSVGDSSLLVDNFSLTGNGTYNVNLASGQTVSNINFGNKQSGDGNQTGNIQGTQWNDLNGNGVQDTGESGLAGWTIYLDTNKNGKLDTGETSTVTDANGNYSFTNLGAGNYTVAEVMQPGWQQTSPGAVSNGSFETGNLTGWTNQGNSSIKTTYSGINPTQGTYQALITNSTGSVSDASLESFLGLSAGALDGMGNGNATEGSAIKLAPITVAAGTTLTFDWDFLTDEATPTSFNDFAFVSINGLKELADTNSTFVTPPGSVKQTGYKQFSYTFTTAGTYTIGLGVVDVGDGAVDSSLLVDNFSLTPNGVYNVNLASGQTVNNINFGNKGISVLAEPNDTIPLAIDSGLSSTKPGTFKDAGAIGDNPNVAAGLDVDFIKFQLNAGDKAIIDIDTNQLVSSFDSYLQLFDASGNQVAFNDNGTASGETSSPDSYLEFTTTTSGTYYLAVSGKGNSSYNPLVQGSGDSGSTGSYNVELSVIPKFSSNFGYGLVDAAAAVAKAVGQSSPFPNVPNFGGTNDWGVNMVNAPEAWDKGYTGKGVIVAVVDTGVDYNHPDLDANIWVNTKEIPNNGKDDDGNGYVDDTKGWDFVDNDNNPMDLNSHGTHVSGTIAAEKNDFGVTGIAYDAKIMPVRVLDAGGSGSSSNVAAGIKYAADNGANVINLSLGGGYSADIEDAVKYATAKGAVVVMAAGNEYASQPGFPANLANQWGVAVGAVDSNDKMAGFSNKAGNTQLDYVVAPGVNVYSTTPGNTYSTYSGTSMATPHVAGVAALILSANPNLTPAEVEKLLIDTANPKGITV